MQTKVFINLPVKNIEKTISFFTNLGFSFNPQFTDDKAACMIISDTVFAMFLAETYFQTYTRKTISDAKSTTEVLLALERSSVDDVKSTIAKAVELGGKTYSDPQDHGWMYQHSFEDLDGHQWELVFLDAQQMPTE
jgi:uncharacterized protein